MRAEAAEATCCACVDSARAKLVHDALRAAGWLHPFLRPAPPDEHRVVAFPIAPAAAAPLRAALTAGEDVLQSVAIEERDASAFATKQPPPQQERHREQRTARRAGAAGGQRGAPQERSFGRGRRRAGASDLPAAACVRRIECNAQTTGAWLRAEVFAARTPAVLSGLPLGPCVGGWSPEKLAGQCARARHTRRGVWRGSRPIRRSVLITCARASQQRRVRVPRSACTCARRHRSTSLATGARATTNNCIDEFTTAMRHHARVGLYSASQCAEHAAQFRLPVDDFRGGRRAMRRARACRRRRRWQR